MILVSHRGPYRFSVRDDGSFAPTRGAGGIVSALAARWSQRDATASDRRGSRPRSATTTAPRSQAGAATGAVGLDLHLLDARPGRCTACTTTSCRTRCSGSCTTACSTSRAAPASTATSATAWDGYVSVNASFADAVVDDARPRASIVLVQDYQLTLVPGMVRDGPPRSAHLALHAHARSADPTRSGCSPTTSPTRCARRWPRCTAGFHTERWARGVRGVGPGGARARRRPAHLRRAARSRSRCAGRVAASRRGRAPSCRARRARRRPAADRAQRSHRSLQEHRARLPARTTCSSTTHPEWRERVVFVAHAQPRRASNLPEYLAYRNEVEQAADARQRALGHSATGSRSSSTHATTTSRPSPGSPATTCCS